MEVIKGLVVKSSAGRDKGGFFAVLEINNGYAVICDGKRRSLEKPKKKKLKHLFITKTILEENAMLSNRAIRRALSPFNNKVI